jgi:translation initiation factor 2D
LIEQVKALSPLRSSDRRKTADQIIADFKINVNEYATSRHQAENAERGTGSEEDQQTTSSNNLTGLRNSLLPENTQSAKFTTTAGPDLKTVNGTLYIGKHDKEEFRVLWVKIDGGLFPTGTFLSFYLIGTMSSN